MTNEQEIAMILAEDPDMDQAGVKLVSLDALERTNTGMVPRRPTMDQQEARIQAEIRAKQGSLLA